MALSDTQTKARFVAEFPVNASPKILFPYLATASGLTQWFCDDVRYVEGQRLNFIWDHEDHYAEISGQRLNRAVRFVFLDEHPDSINDGYFINRGDYHQWLDLPASYHNGAASFSFADGHSEMHRWLLPRTKPPPSPEAAQLPIYLAEGERGDLYWMTERMSVEPYASDHY